jgi:iron complex outermembrane receptor protein
MISNPTRRLAVVALAVFPALFPVSGSAAVEEMIVTSERREANLQEVPIAVTGLSETTLENRNVLNVENIGPNVPNLLTTKSSSSPANVRVFMRGLGQSESMMPTAEGTVGMYVDDAYVARTNGSNQKLLDIERVEVLRGPQGTLYGRNTISGAMKFITRKPTDEARLDASASGGAYSENDANTFDAKISGATPVGDSGWGLGGAAIYSDQDGYMERYSAPGVSTGEKVGDRKFSGGRLQVAYFGSDFFDFDMSVAATQDESDALYITPLNPDGTSVTGGNLYTTLTSQDQFADADQINSNATLAWHFNGFDLKSITSIRDIENNSHIDISGQDSWYITTFIDTTQISQEIQLLGTAFDDRFDWIAGGFYMNEDSDVDSNNLIAGRFTNQQIYNTKLDSYAVFGQFTWRFTEQLGLTLGGRYTVDDKSFDGSVIAAGPPSWVSGTTSQSEDWNEFTPKIGLDYQVNDNTLLYAYAANGFQAGGFQARAFSITDLDNTFDPTTVWTYEMGAKLEMIGNRVRLNAAFFHNDYDDLQINSLNSEAGGGTIVQNAAEATVHGFEFELSTNPINGLNLFATLATAWSDYQKLDDAALAGRVALGDRIPGTPELTTSIGGDYGFAVGRGEMSLGADYYHQKKHQPGTSTSPTIQVPNIDLINAYVRYTTPGESWDFTLYGKNLTAEEYIFTGFSFSSFESGYAADPRQIMLTAQYHLR